jgi:hypothetical protein
MNVHTVAPEPPPRCPLCTLRQPCSNCSYDIARAALVATCTAAAATVSDTSSQLAKAQALLQLSPSKGNSRSSIIANKNFAAVMPTAARRELEALSTALHEVCKTACAPISYSVNSILLCVSPVTVCSMTPYTTTHVSVQASSFA